MEEYTYVLQMEGIYKSFPGVKALNGVDIKIRPGTVHSLMGENGAGKSTLMKCLFGIYKPDDGKVFFKGRQVKFSGTLDALNCGISMIHQELTPIRDRTIAENVWVGREPMHYGIFTDDKRMVEDTRALFGQLNIDMDPRERMGSLTVAKMQLVEIVKAVSYQASVVIMDEPTSALTAGETEHLFRIIAQLKAQGVAIIYISHKMDEIFRISDEITVLRDGRFIHCAPAAELDSAKLITLMVGRDMDQLFPKVVHPIKEVILKVEGLACGKLFSDVSFEVRRGEILGFAGLVGAGRTEVLETVFGFRKKTAGKIYVHGREVDIKSPNHAIAHGIALLTEDRRGSGIIPVLPVESNITISSLRKYLNSMRLLNTGKMRKYAIEYAKKLNVKTPGVDTKIENLSGGNQQKALVARWLLTDPDILMVDEPTRGIDVGAKAEIHALISEMAGEGKAIIMVSSEMQEVLAVSDKILVMHEGKVNGIIGQEEANQELVMQHAAGLHNEEEKT